MSNPLASSQSETGQDHGISPERLAALIEEEVREIREQLQEAEERAEAAEEDAAEAILARREIDEKLRMVQKELNERKEPSASNQRSRPKKKNITFSSADILCEEFTGPFQPA